MTFDQNVLVKKTSISFLMCKQESLGEALARLAPQANAEVRVV